MANKIYVCQRTNRHVIKRLDSTSAPATYDSMSFGVFGSSGSGATHLDNPLGITIDSANTIYVCDTVNKRIIKLSSSLLYVGFYDTSLTVGEPFAILYNVLNNDLYIVGVFNNTYVRIERINVVLSSIKVSSNLGQIKCAAYKPISICNGFTVGSFLVCHSDLSILETIETTSFSAFVAHAVFGETTTYPNLFATTKYNGIIKHTDGYLYVNNGRKILRIDSSFMNMGDSDDVNGDNRFYNHRDTTAILRQGLNDSLLIYNAYNKKIIRYDNNLNFIEDVYINTGSTISTDAYDIADFVEVNI